MITKIDKAIVAFVIAAAGVITTAQLNGGTVDTTVLVSAAIVGLIAGLGVWLAPNKTDTPTPVKTP